MATYNYNYNPDDHRDNKTGTDNETQYANKPIKGGTTTLVVNETYIRQVPRVGQKIIDWRSAHQVAESRYFPNRTWLYNMYDDVILDGHLSGIMSKRIDTVLNKHLYFAEANGSPTTNAELLKLLGSVEFRLVMRTMLETQLWGISGLEFEPGKSFTPRVIPRKHIKPKWQVIAIDENGRDGVDYTTADNLYIIGQPEDLGLLLKCVPYVIYKRNNTGDWGQYIEIFGQPIRVMYYDAYDQQVKLELKQTLDDSGGSMALMIPKGVEFDIKDGKVTNGDGKLQDTFKDYLNEEMSVIILGNTETTTHNGQTGTGGKSKVHSQQQNEILKSDIAYLTAYLNTAQFLSILESYGYPVKGGRFAFHPEINIAEQSEQIDIDVKLETQLGLPLDHDELYKYYGRTKPKDYEARLAEIKAAKQPMAADPEEDAENEPGKPGKKQSKKPSSPNSKKPKPLSHSKLRNLLYSVQDFFGQALT